MNMLHELYQIRHTISGTKKNTCKETTKNIIASVVQKTVGIEEIGGRTQIKEINYKLVPSTMMWSTIRLVPGQENWIFHLKDKQKYCLLGSTGLTTHCRMPPSFHLPFKQNFQYHENIHLEINLSDEIVEASTRAHTPANFHQKSVWCKLYGCSYDILWEASRILDP